MIVRGAPDRRSPHFSTIATSHWLPPQASRYTPPPDPPTPPPDPPLSVLMRPPRILHTLACWTPTGKCNDRSDFEFTNNTQLINHPNGRVLRCLVRAFLTKYPRYKGLNCMDTKEKKFMWHNVLLVAFTFWYDRCMLWNMMLQSWHDTTRLQGQYYSVLLPLPTISGGVCQAVNQLVCVQPSLIIGELP